MPTFGLCLALLAAFMMGVSFGVASRDQQGMQSELFSACKAFLDAPRHTLLKLRLNSEENAAIDRIKLVIRRIEIHNRQDGVNK